MSAPDSPPPHRAPGSLWFAVIGLFGLAYAFMFSVIHPLVDTRRCLGPFADPFFALVPPWPQWEWITHGAFSVMNFVGLGATLYCAARGDHRPYLRWTLGLAFQAILRSTTLALLPLCQAGVPQGGPALAEMPTLSLGPLQIPWRMWATNDLMFSGHVGQYLLLWLALRKQPGMPRGTASFLLAYQIVQLIALLGTREHYSIDIVVAVPCTYLVDFVTRRAMGLWGVKVSP